jgi:hypothetical protein
VVASIDTTLHAWHAERGTLLHRYTHEHAVVASGVCEGEGTGLRASTCVALAASDGGVATYDVDQQRATAAWSLPAELGAPRSLVASRHSDWLAVAGLSGAVAILERRMGSMSVSRFCCFIVCEMFTFHRPNNQNI